MSKTSKAMKTAAVALLGAAALGGDWGKAAQTAAQDAQATENSINAKIRQSKRSKERFISILLDRYCSYYIMCSVINILSLCRVIVS